MLASYTLLSLSSNFLFSTYTYQNKIKRSEFVTNLLILFLSLLLIRVFFSFFSSFYFFGKIFVKTRFFFIQKIPPKKFISVLRIFIQTRICDVMFSLNRILRMKNYSVNIWRRFKTVVLYVGWTVCLKTSTCLEVCLDLYRLFAFLLPQNI